MGTLRDATIILTLLATYAAAETDIELADKLFAEGLALRDTNLTQSCEKFSLSLQKNPQAIGTLLNVALCDEKLGRIASAHARFSEARDRAKEGNLPEYLAEAQSHIDKLAPDLPYVEIKFLGEKPPGTKVLIGDRVVPNAKIDNHEKYPVDPGELVIVVSAPGRLSYETKMLIAKQETKPIEVPQLAKGVVTVKKGNTRRAAGIITTIGGGAMILASQILGYKANLDYKEEFEKADAATKGCVRQMDGEPICEAEAQARITSARTLGSVGTYIGVAGLVVTGVGLYLWISAPSDKPEQRRQISVVPTVSPEAAGLAAVGRF